MFAALAARVSDPVRDAKYDGARKSIANYAFIPSRVWNDTATWTGATPARRTLQIAGFYRAGRYHLEAMPDAPAPTRLADGRHLIDLTRLSDDEFAWNTDVGYAIGGIGAAQAARAFAALFTSAAAGAPRGEPGIRAEYRGTVPRATAVLGQLFHVDSIRATYLSDGSTMAAYSVTLTPRTLEPRYPHFARYLQRYGSTARIRFALADSSDVFLEAALRDGRLTLRVRARNGALLAVASGRPMPDSLTLQADVALRIRRFTVGFSEYRGEFAMVRTPHERALVLTSRQEPKWDLPFIAERLLRTPLRRPFQGSGALFRIGVREDPGGGQTLLHRRLHLEVQESTILRFIGRLGAMAVSDFSEQTEREQYAWLKELFDAFTADLRDFRAD